MTKFAPVFTKDGNRFIVCNKDYISDCRTGATEIGIGVLFGEAIVYNFKWLDQEVIELDMKNTTHISAELGRLPIAILSGPIFDKMEEEHEGIETNGADETDQ